MHDEDEVLGEEEGFIMSDDLDLEGEPLGDLKIEDEDDDPESRFT